MTSQSNQVNVVTDWDSDPVADLIRELTVIRTDIVATDRHFEALEQSLHPTYRQSARNLLHYLALRRHDIRPLQERLASLGLSSLGRAESHVLNSLDTVLRNIYLLAQLPMPGLPHVEADIDYIQGKALLNSHTLALLGPEPARRNVRIMVTMPSEAASDYALVRDLLARGMDCMRINCAHDDKETWGAMIANLRHAEEELGKPCRLLMDLGGPKLRTGPIAAGPPVLSWKPRRDRRGKVIAPARLWLTPADRMSPPPDLTSTVLPLAGSGLRLLHVGDRLECEDANNTECSLEIIERSGEG